MFAVLACKTKMNAPKCHTYLEIIYARYGKSAHLVRTSGCGVAYYQTYHLLAQKLWIMSRQCPWPDTNANEVFFQVFLFFALVTNILVGSQLLLGGSAVVTALTGMNVYAAVFLIRESFL